jgi:CIC family chloride channel protein
VQNVISNGSGASVGLEAGYTQLASGLASRLGIAFEVRRSDLRTLVGCGAAGAIAAGFGAPLAGAFYAFELIIGTYSIATLAPVVVAALCGNLVSRSLIQTQPLVELGDMQAVTTSHITSLEILPSLALGLICALLGILIMRGVTLVEQLVQASGLPRAAGPAFGGLCVGALALIATPQVLSGGHGALHMHFAVEGQGYGVAALAALFAAKATATAISIGSGFRGGLFFASLFLGAIAGKLFAALAPDLVPAMAGFGLTPLAYAVIGMSALAVAIIGGPLTMTFLALEITGSLPITGLVLAAVIASSLTVRKTFGYSFATWRFHLRGESIRSPHDVGWIRSLTVGRLMRRDVATARPSARLTLTGDRRGWAGSLRRDLERPRGACRRTGRRGRRGAGVGRPPAPHGLVPDAGDERQGRGRNLRPQRERGARGGPECRQPPGPGPAYREPHPQALQRGAGPAAPGHGGRIALAHHPERWLPAFERR